MKPFAAIAALAVLMGARSSFTASAVEGPVVHGTVHSITLPEGEPELPQAPGRETTQAFCISCHTVQYIMIQPRLSRETWTAEVTKMRKAFSAPIPEDKVSEIVGYLVAVRGVEKQ